MLTSPTARDSEKLWPSLAMPPNAQKSVANTQSSSFFGDAKITQVSGGKKVTAPPKEDDGEAEEEDEDDEIECKAPAYKNNLSDALINALKSKASMCETNAQFGTSGAGRNKKKKGKKTLLFSSGMNFN